LKVLTRLTRLTRSHRSPTHEYRIDCLAAIVVVCGAAGGIGQPLSLLLKQSEIITHLALYDIVHAAGVAADLSHINTPSKVTGHAGKDSLAEALKGAHTVVIPAGVPRKPGMTRDDLFKVNIFFDRPWAHCILMGAEKCVFVC